jgi:hypothetical protein
MKPFTGDWPVALLRASGLRADQVRDRVDDVEKMGSRAMAPAYGHQSGCGPAGGVCWNLPYPLWQPERVPDPVQTTRLF